jgi:hypothetical protein
MFRFAVVALALCSSPALAASHYHAVPAAAPANTKVVVRDTVWSCGNDGCRGSTSSSRPAIVCAVFAREVGELQSFAVQGRPISPDELAKCNARAR